MAKARALPVTRWAHKQAPLGFFTSWWGVHKSTACRRINEGRNALTEVCAYVEHSGANGEAFVAAVLESLERKYVREAAEDRKACEARLARLIENEHDREAAQNRALQSGKGVEDACLQHVASLLEIVGRRRALGMEEE